LRAELSLAISKRDDAVSAATESQRKVVLLQEELREHKLKLSRATQEKLKLERDSVRAVVVSKSTDIEDPLYPFGRMFRGSSHNVLSCFVHFSTHPNSAPPCLLREALTARKTAAAPAATAITTSAASPNSRDSWPE